MLCALREPLNCRLKERSSMPLREPMYCALREPLYCALREPLYYSLNECCRVPWGNHYDASKEPSIPSSNYPSSFREPFSVISLEGTIMMPWGNLSLYCALREPLWCLQGTFLCFVPGGNHYDASKEPSIPSSNYHSSFREHFSVISLKGTAYNANREPFFVLCLEGTIVMPSGNLSLYCALRNLWTVDWGTL